MFLTTEHRRIVKQWFGVSRFVYNTTVKLVQDPSIKANWKGIKTDILNKLPQWSKSVPY
ncbi:helix-turn-helix domain-containing protein, partial [Umezakia ovalisporum]